MDNKLFEDLLGFPQLQVNNVTITKDRIDIYCASKFKACHCPVCLQPQTKINQQYERTLRDLPISGRQVTLHLMTYQFECPRCNRFFYEQFNFVEPNGQLTRRYEDFIYKRCIGVELQYVVVQEDVCWKTVNRIFKKKAAGESRHLFDEVRALGIDEIALKKGHADYACVLVNLETGQVIDVLADRSKDYLIKYFQDLGEAFCKRIEIFSSDLWKGYISTGEQMFPHATIVLDRFHYFSHIEKAVDAARKSLRRAFKDREELKRIKYGLLKNGDELDEEQKQQLADLFSHVAYRPLKEAYEAKEAFRALFERSLSREKAEVLLKRWEDRTQKKRNRFLAPFLKLVDRWRGYILNYFVGYYSNGIVEGINNKIKLIKRRSFGYVNFGNFRRRVLVEFSGLHHSTRQNMKGLTL